MLIKHQAPVTRGILLVGGWVDLSYIFWGNDECNTE